MDRNTELTRRRFLKGIVAASAGAIASPQLRALEGEIPSKKLSATDSVRLGKTGLRISRLGMGTGSRSGRIQRELGQEAFTHLVRHALDRGITFIDTADNYEGLHEMLRVALKGVDRGKIQIQCKIPHGKYEDPLKEIDRFRKEVGTDYFDSMLIHCARTHNWPEEEKRLRDLLNAAKEKKIIRATGVSMHGLLPLRAAAATGWGDVRQVRINHNGKHMDGLNRKPAEVQPVVDCIRKMHDAGKGIIGMKLIGNGDFKDAESRKASLDFVLGLDCVDAVVIGFKSPQEVDEAITRINSALARRA